MLHSLKELKCTQLSSRLPLSVYSRDHLILNILLQFNMIPEHRNEKLQQLATYLRGLPNSLALKSSEDSHYDFQGFEPDPEWVEDIGTVEGAVNRELEC